jgi:hypothetical protein
MTQRDDDIAQLEAKLKAERLFKEWQDGYMGKRRDDAEDSNVPVPDDLGNAGQAAY